MSIKLQGGNNSSNLVNVNSLQEIKVVMPLNGLTAGFVQLSTEVDAGDVTGSRSVVSLESSDDYRLRVGVDQSIFNATFEGIIPSTALFLNSASTFSNNQANGFFTLNSVSVTTSPATSYMRTHRHFPTFGTYPIYADMWIREGNFDATNAISEWGFLHCVTFSAPQVNDGIYFRRTSGGQLSGIVTTNGIDTEVIIISTENLPSRNGVGRFDPAKSNHYLIAVHNDIVHFWINHVMVGEIRCPSSQSTFSGSSNLPIGLRVLNTVTTASAARQLSVGFINVSLGDQNTGKPWSHALCGMGAGAYQVQPGNASAPTVTRTTGAQGHPASGTLRITGTYTATSAPALNNLGGLWTSPAISTLASDADFPVFAFQNPVGSAALPGKTLYVTGVRVGEAFASVAASTNPILLSYIVMVDGSFAAGAVDGVDRTSAKSIVIGGHGFGATDDAGTMKEGFTIDFPSPLVVSSGKFFTIVVRPFGTVTSNTLVVRGSVAVNGYFE